MAEKGEWVTMMDVGAEELSGGKERWLGTVGEPNATHESLPKISTDS